MKKVLVIAEAGVNHNGSLEIAKQLVEAALGAGADIVKFQTFTADNLVCKWAEKAAYQMQTTGLKESQYQMLKRLELTIDEYRELSVYCGQKKIEFLSSPFDLDSIALVNELNVRRVKIPSGEITNFPYLKRCAETGKSIILSTGMSECAEIEAALNVLKKYGAGEIAILHCNTQYPTPMEDVNLNVIPMLQNRFGIETGYSDHTSGTEAAIAAVALGATIIEKHFTLDRHMDGPDHKASLEPDELKYMVQCIRNIEKALGTCEKGITKSERDNRMIVRKSIVASRSIRKGEIFSEENLTTKRPGNGISPMRWNEVTGKTANRDYVTDEMISL